jgi:alkylation response protein AidB-like acyl-CoA dehydrogenase
VSTAFVADVYASVPFLVCLFPDQAQDDVFGGDGSPKLINTFNPGGGATRTDGGFVLSGKWPFATGQHHADWAIMSAVTNRPDDTMDIGFFLAPRSEFECLDDWQVTGMGGTGSATLSVGETFVPSHRALFISDLLAGNFESTLAREDPYYQVPVLAFTLAGLAGTATGAAEGILDLFKARVPRRGITYTTYTSQAEAPVTHLQMAEAQMKADEARFHADRIVAIAESGGTDIPLAIRARCRADAAWAVRLAREVAEIVHSASGASAIHRRDPLQRMLRDIQAFSVHSLMLATTNAELYGRVLCGMDPGTPFV